MTSTKKRKEKALGASTKQNVVKTHKSVKKSTGCSNGRKHKVSKHGKHFLDAKDEPTSAFQGEGLLTHDKDTPVETNDEVPSMEIEHKQTPHFSPKIKLQLFPLDERIRLGLEKDGHNPYLELTLRARKKVSSVLNHLKNKWGSSSIAAGEPMLFPFDIMLENLASYRRWTLNDISISAGDVYAHFGNPAVFRLRYGWFTIQPNTPCIPTASTPIVDCSEPEFLENAHNTISEATCGTKKQPEVTGELRPSNTSEPSNMAAVEQLSSARVLNSKESCVDNALSHTSFLWSDFLTNTSIGGLISEASILGKINIPDTISNGTRSAVPPDQLILDSLDAFIADQLKCAQEPPNVSLGIPSSILDAEETCHSFAFQKSPSSGKDLGAGGSVLSVPSSNVCIEPYKNLERTEVNTKHALLDINSCQEPKTDPLTCFRGAHNDESSLGLSGIKWNDSLGPFDLGPPSQQIIMGDSLHQWIF
ncbi:hypothetical protein Nepgr_008499 [Nepenthes gracilis]|uniref:TSL-kinase interacting protein 1 n=1 Tax=Nepenthes gracilis TaxID=150966 RepID=A0AAD3XJB7_NEPGR|nr:hypothetical protein Nepgr_008499 [Nepenthes gracilis]